MLKVEGKMKTVWTIDGNNIVLVEGKKTSTVPLSQVKGVEHTPPPYSYSWGTIKLNIGQAPDGGIAVGRVGLLVSLSNLIYYKQNQKEAAAEFVSYLNNNIGAATVAAPALSEADELLKFKGLLDAGVITQAEFDAKKAQLLGL